MAEDNGIGGSGYDLDALSQYHDRGRTPAIAAIDSNPECQAVLASMARFGSMSTELIAREAAEAAPLDESWFAGLMAVIATEVRAGRDITYPDPDPLTRLTITEGAVRELVRVAGDSVPGVLVGTCRLDGDVTDAEAEIRVSVTISVVFNAPLVEIADTVRNAVYSALIASTPLRIGSIDVTVDDVHLPVETEPLPDAGAEGETR